MNRTITVATVNTHEARMLRDTNGLVPFSKVDTDFLLMQEVLRISHQDLEARLGRDGFGIAHFDSETGLAIALSHRSKFHPAQGSARTDTLTEPTAFSRWSTRDGGRFSTRLRRRGLIAVKAASGDSVVTVANTHPIIFLRALARAKQISKIGELIMGDYYGDYPLILGGDMNHYPGPHLVDRELMLGAGLKSVQLDQPTWRIRGSKHEWAARVASRVYGKSIDEFDAVLDAILYRGLTVDSVKTAAVASDHDAVIAKLEYN